ncbi:MAG: Uma2 family endonuclease [Blastocatellia bacterium]
MATGNLQTQDRILQTPGIPPLRHGDRLSREEFERLYEAMPGVTKAELIEGRVHMPSPVRVKNHGDPHHDIGTWLGVYKAFTLGVSGSDNASVRLDTTNEPQPDIHLRIDESHGGQARISPDDYLEGAPELVAEISASSASHDLRGKKEAYHRNGVREYIVWSVYDREINWFSLENDQYVSLDPDDDGVIRSRVFPGLWLDVAALLKDDMATVLTVLQQGLASEEHAAFVNHLNEVEMSIAQVHGAITEA